MADVLRNAQANGVDQAWPADWAALASHRKQAEAYRQAGHLRAALRELGEAIDLLGVAARLHRKERGQNGSS